MGEPDDNGGEQMMARADLSSMLGKLESVEAAPAAPPATASRPSAQPAARKSARKREQKPVTPAPRSIQPKEIPLFSSLERKEARLREDQYTSLTAHARRLNRAKGTGGERITENTLIRVAIDLLLSQVDRLEGATEKELTDSVTNRVKAH
jgi:hypothetical protein